MWTFCPCLVSSLSLFLNLLISPAVMLFHSYLHHVCSSVISRSFSFIFSLVLFLRLFRHKVLKFTTFDNNPELISQGLILFSSDERFGYMHLPLSFTSSGRE